MRISDWSSDVCSSDLFHLTAPGAVAAPSFLREVVGRRGEDVRQVVPDVAVAVAVVVDGEVHEGRGNELELAHGAGPGAGHRGGGDVALVDDLQRFDKLGAEDVVTTPLLRHAGPSGDPGLPPRVPAQPAPPPPPRHPETRGHAPLRTPLAQQRPAT